MMKKIMLTVPDVSPPAAQMYGGDDDLTSSSGSEVELETVKTADAYDNPFRGKVLLPQSFLDCVIFS